MQLHILDSLASATGQVNIKESAQSIYWHNRGCRGSFVRGRVRHDGDGYSSQVLVNKFKTCQQTNRQRSSIKCRPPILRGQGQIAGAERWQPPRRWQNNLTTLSMESTRSPHLDRRNRVACVDRWQSVYATKEVGPRAETWTEVTELTVLRPVMDTDGCRRDRPA